MHLPENIAAYTAGKAYTEESIGMSGAAVMMFDDMVLKIEPENDRFDDTVRILEWLAGRLPVPKVICTAKEDGRQYLLMSRARGSMLCAPEIMDDIENAVSLYAEALKMLWRVDIADCPRACSIDMQLKDARRRVEKGLIDIEDCEPETFGPGGFKSPEALLEWLENNRPEVEPALSHGDFCMPNIFVDDGRVSCYIDLGDTGIADKWRDIALCWRSLKHNCTGKYAARDLGDQTELLFKKLGVEPDWDKIKYYLLMDELF